MAVPMIPIIVNTLATLYIVFSPLLKIAIVLNQFGTIIPNNITVGCIFDAVDLDVVKRHLFYTVYIDRALRLTGANVVGGDAFGLGKVYLNIAESEIFDRTILNSYRVFLLAIGSDVFHRHVPDARAIFRKGIHKDICINRGNV